MELVRRLEELRRAVRVMLDRQVEGMIELRAMQEKIVKMDDNLQKIAALAQDKLSGSGDA